MPMPKINSTTKTEMNLSNWYTKLKMPKVALQQETILHLLSALKDNKANLFVREAYKEHYIHHFYSRRHAILAMIEEMFGLLNEAVSSRYPTEALKSVITTIPEDIFRNKERTFWFNRMYMYYKKYTRADLEYQQIKPFIKGTKILDFGSGAGFFSLKLQENELDVSSCDVLDYRISDTIHIPFKQMYQPTTIEYKDKSFDTITVKAVLHHIDPEYLPAIFSELKRVGHRIIIEETVYGLDNNIEGVNLLSNKQSLLSEFLRLNLKQQKNALMIIDYITNILVFGEQNINMPFAYKTLPEWRKILEENNIRVVTIEPLGFEKERVTPDCRALIVCETIS